MAKTWIQSYLNRRVDPLALKPEQVSFDDIVTALSRKARFSGLTQGSTGYSVAQHTVLGSRCIDKPFALAFLLHEVSEVYLPDIPNPVKHTLFVDIDGFTVPWRDLESIHADVIFEALGLSSLRPLIDAPEVKEMDLAMLATEKRDLMGPEPEPWGLVVPAIAGLYITGDVWTEEESRTQWLMRFDELSGKAQLRHAAKRSVAEARAP